MRSPSWGSTGASLERDVAAALPLGGRGGEQQLLGAQPAQQLLQRRRWLPMWRRMHATLI